MGYAFALRECSGVNNFETSATVENQGQVRLAGVPFAPGTEVEITIRPKRRSAEEFAVAWRRVCDAMRSEANGISDEEICDEIDRHRNGK
jgi:hypothetical protein